MVSGDTGCVAPELGLFPLVGCGETPGGPDPDVTGSDGSVVASFLTRPSEGSVESVGMKVTDTLLA